MSGTPPEIHRAILVAHGVGQQHPFQVLDNVAHGLAKSLAANRYGVTVQHILKGRDDAFDHCIRIEADPPDADSAPATPSPESSGGVRQKIRRDLANRRAAAETSDSLPPGRRVVDIYEYYWAPLTDRRASFLQVLRWVHAASLTPLRRLAFNLPLIRRRAEAKAAGTNGAEHPRYTRQFLHELWRVVWMPILWVFIAALIAALFRSAPAVAATVKRWTDILVAGVRSSGDVLTLLVILAIGVALVALLESLYSQVKDFWRLSRRERPGMSLLARPAHVARLALLGLPAVEAPDGATRLLFRRTWAPAVGAQPPTGGLSRIPGLGRAVRAWRTSAAVETQLAVELRARLLFLRLSVAMIGLLVAILLGLAILPRPIGLTPVLRRLLEEHVMPATMPLSWWIPTVGWMAAVKVFRGLAVPILLVALAAWVKVVFVDYVADIALYVTADEHSSFYRTRLDILTRATEKLRWLVRQAEYQEVAIAGHSLGSVIMYDAYSWLRIESLVRTDEQEAYQYAHSERVARFEQLLTAKLDKADETPGRVRTPAVLVYRDTLLATYQTRIVDDTGIRNLFDSVVAALESAPEVRHPSTASVDPDELSVIRTLVTFGSPLDKIVYFFRTKLHAYESVRAHIVEELHGFRRWQEFRADDLALQHAGFPPATDGTLRWLNVSSLLDPISSPLYYFEDIDEVRRPYWVPGFCHTQYWHDPEFYRAVLRTIEGLEPRSGHWFAGVLRSLAGAK